MNYLHLLAGLLILTVIAASPRAHSATLVTPTVPGLSGGIYKPTAASITGGSFSALGVVTISGKPITVPATLPPAANAASYARNTLFSNPWLVGLSLLTWANEAGLTSDLSAWTYTASTPGEGSAECLVSGWGSGFGDTWDEACTALLATRPNQCPSWHTSTGSCFEPGASWNPATNKLEYYISQYCSVSDCVGGLTYGQLIQAHKFQHTNASVAGTESDPEGRPATLEDFDSLPDPSIDVLADLAPQVGVPVGDPVFDPVDAPIGNPYTKPDGSTAQQRASISPAGDGDVWVDVYEQPLTDSQGNPISNPEPVDQPEATPTQCEKFPNTLGCALLDEVPDGDLPAENRDVALITPVDLGGAGQCPAPLTANVLGTTVEMSFDPLCQYANALRPLVLALAWLGAGVIFIGGVRHG